MKHIILASLLAASFAASATWAEKGRVTITPMIGAYLPDDGFNNGKAWSLGLGYQFAERWGAELSYLDVSLPTKNSNTGTDRTVGRLDVLHFFKTGDTKPFVLAGLGNEDIDYSNGTEGSQNTVNIGAGVLHTVSDAIDLRAEIRAIEGLDFDNTDQLVSIGATFKLGGSKAPVKRVRDDDNDGVQNKYDQCPTTPKNTPVNSVGCKQMKKEEAPKDSDNDGVVDSMDECPNSEAGAKVNSKGCYEVLKEDVSVTLNVNFLTNSAELRPGALQEIKELADFLRAYPNTNVVIEGHTDSDGAASYNKDLSQRRADTVAAILVNQFKVDQNRVSAVGYGEERPLVANDSRENKAKNRRVTGVVKAIKTTVIK